MKSSTVWHGHSTRPSLPAGTARKARGHLSGRRPLHLANARPFGRSKAPLGLLLLRKRELALAGGTGSLYPKQRKTERSRWGTPCCTYRYRLWSLAGCVRVGAPCFFFFTMLHHFLRAASGIRHQHGSGSDAAHPGIVPIFFAGTPYKHARMQCHFPAYFPILSA